MTENKQSICELGAEFRIKRKKQLENELLILMKAESNKEPAKPDLYEATERLRKIVEATAIDFKKLADVGEIISRTPLFLENMRELDRHQKISKHNILRVLIVLGSGFVSGLLVGYACFG